MTSLEDPMSICYYLPGFAGSSLAASPGGSLYWGSTTAAITTPTSSMGLAPDGSSPLLPCGTELLPVGLYADYYAEALAAFQLSLVGTPVSVSVYSYDWRFAISKIGASLASVIQTQISAAEPCTIVAHSAGGLVARAAWLALVQMGASGLVRRIVTYGTPHQGSYGAVRLWSLDSPSLTAVQYLALARAALRIPAPPYACDPISAAAIAGTTTTWPGLYDTLPLVGGSESAADPLRAMLYLAANWIGPVQPSQTWLSYSASFTRAWLLDPASVPPAWILTTIAGTGIPTAGMLRLAGSIGLADAYTVAADGDGTVTTASALIPESAQITLACLHEDLPLRLASSGVLAAAVLDPRVAPSPAPPLAVVPGPTVPLFGPVPIPALGYPAGGGTGRSGC